MLFRTELTAQPHMKTEHILLNFCTYGSIVRRLQYTWHLYANFAAQPFPRGSIWCTFFSFIV